MDDPDAAAGAEGVAGVVGPSNLDARSSTLDLEPSQVADNLARLTSALM